MRAKLLAATAVAVALVSVAAPAHAQRNQRDPQPSAPTPLAQQAMASSSQPDVLLDVPNLSIEQLTVDVTNLQVHLALDAQLANLLHLTAGADARIDNVRIDLRGVRAQATLIVRLENVRAIIERTLQTLDNNPELVNRLLSTVDNTVGTVGNVANNTVNTVGGIANSALRNGQLLNLAGSGLTEVSRTVNGAGQTVRRVTDRGGQALEVVTDAANRIVSWRRVPSAPTGPGAPPPGQ
jgi:hypothetical protein